MLFNLQHLRLRVSAAALHAAAQSLIQSLRLGFTCCCCCCCCPCQQRTGQGAGQDLTRNCSTSILLKDFLFYFWFIFEITCTQDFHSLCVCLLFFFPVAFAAISLRQHIYILFLFFVLLFKYHLFNMIVLNVFSSLLYSFPKYFFSNVSKIN